MLPYNMYPLKGLSGRVDTDITNKPVTQFAINPMIVSANIRNDMYIFTFNNMCYNNLPNKGYLNVDSKVLKEKLEAWIKPSDRKYIKLAYFDKQTSKFVFDIEAWLEDGMKNCTAYGDPMKMSKTYRLSVKLPYMIGVYGNEFEFSKYISEHFKKALVKKPELRKNIFGIIEDISRKHLKMDSVGMFEYNYNRMSNAVSVSVKPHYAAGLVASATILLKDESWKKKIDFDKTVGMFLKIR